MIVTILHHSQSVLTALGYLAYNLSSIDVSMLFKYVHYFKQI